MTQPATTDTTVRAWFDVIADQLDADPNTTGMTHAVVEIPNDRSREALLLGCASDEQAAQEIVDDAIADNPPSDSEITVHEIAYIRALAAGAVHEIEKQRRNEETTEPERQLETPAQPAVPSPEEEEEESAPPAASKLEQVVLDEQAAHDAAEKALFDASDYDREDLAISKIDGVGIGKIAVAFSGRVLLDRSDPRDVALYNRLRMGREVELRCAGKVTAAGAGWTTNRDGGLDAVVGEKRVKVDTVWVLEPENLRGPAEEEAAARITLPR